MWGWLVWRAAADCARGANPVRAEGLAGFRADADWTREAACPVIAVDELRP